MQLDELQVGEMILQPVSDPKDLSSISKPSVEEKYPKGLEFKYVWSSNIS